MSNFVALVGAGLIGLWVVETLVVMLSLRASARTGNPDSGEPV